MNRPGGRAPERPSPLKPIPFAKKSPPSAGLGSLQCPVQRPGPQRGLLALSLAAGLTGLALLARVLLLRLGRIVEILSGLPLAGLALARILLLLLIGFLRHVTRLGLTRVLLLLLLLLLILLGLLL